MVGGHGAFHVDTGSLLVGDPLLGAEDLGLLAEGLAGQLEIIGDAGAAVVGSAALRRDEHDAVTGLRAVDGGGGGILQDLDGLDHFRIQILDVVHLQTVHDEERSKGAGVGGVTADADGSACARSTGSVDDLDTGSLALEGGGGIGGGPVLEVFRTDGSNGTGQVALALDTVTDHHGLIEEHRVLLEDDAELTLVSHGDDLFGITDAGDTDGGSGRNIESERTIQSRDGSNGGIADDNDGRTHDRCTGLIDDNAADGAVLGRRKRPAQQAGRKDDRGGHFGNQMLCHRKDWFKLVLWVLILIVQCRAVFSQPQIYPFAYAGTFKRGPKKTKFQPVRTIFTPIPALLMHF